MRRRRTVLAAATLRFNWLRGKTSPSLLLLVSLLRYVDAVKAALNLLARESPLLAWGLDLFIKRATKRIEISFRVTLRRLVTRKQFQDYLLGSTANIVSQLVGSAYPPRSLFVSRSPSSSESIRGYERFFQVPVALGVDASPANL